MKKQTTQQMRNAGIVSAGGGTERQTERLKSGRFQSSILPSFHSSILLALLAAGMMAGTARATEYLVATNGADTGNSGTSWDQPFKTISNAVAKGDCTIVTVSNGTYNITAQILITNAITVRSFGNGVYGGLANASNTVVQGSGGDTRIFSITNAATVLDGFTIRNGAGRGDGFANRYLGGGDNWDGHGVYMLNGLVQNCIVKENGIVGNNSLLQGGGVFMEGGTVSNCTIQANLTGGGESDGGGIYATGGQILFCRILGNTSGGGTGGGGIYASSAAVLIRNCLIATNSCTGNGGGVYQGLVESCTIVSNNASGGTSSGGGVFGSTVTNSIILKNRTGSGILSVADYSGGTLSYSCATPKPAGVGNVADAAFVNLGAGDYRLMACPAVDSGTNLAWMAGALDLAGNPRTNGVNNRVDMGAYELVPGALQCGLAADVTSVTAPSNVVFTSYVAGTNRNATSYTWDFGDGNTTNGATLAVVTNLYTAAGSYTVKLTVTNDANESFTATNAGYITVWGTTAYVWASSPSPAAPYQTWANAAQTIGAAVAAVPAGTTVLVTNGTYTTSEIFLNKTITVRSFGNGVYGGLGNASNTIVQNGGTHIFTISDANAVVDGLTIQKFTSSVQGDGGAVILTGGGLVRDCIIQDNVDGNNHLYGAGIYVTGGGTVSNCVIRRNKVNVGNAYGGGVYLTSGLITHCQILNNTNNNIYGGGVYMNGASAILRNCLIANNYVAGTAQGGGVYIGTSGGSVQNCTIVTNKGLTGNGGGVYLAAGTVSNSIVYWNYVGATHSNLNTTVGLGYSCSTAPGTTANSNTNVDPNISFTDYSLNADSPCIDKGSNQAWMDGAKDLAGNARKIYAGQGGSAGAPVVDMGAYENIPSPLITVPVGTLAFGNVITNTVSAETNYTVSGSFLTASVTVTAPANFEVSTTSGSGFGPSVVLTPVDGTLSATTIYVRFLPTTVGAYSANISHTSSGATTRSKAVSGGGVRANAPTLLTVPPWLDFENVITNKTSVEQTYQVSGSNLEDNVTVTAPAGFWIYTNGGSLVQSLTLTTNLPGKLDPAVTVYVRFVPTAPISYNASISNTSAGAVENLVDVSGAGVVQGLSASGGPLPFGTVVINRTNTLSYTVSGSNLEDNVIVTAPSSEFTFSTNLSLSFAPSLSLAPVGGAPTGGVLAATTVYVRFIPTSIQVYGGNIVNSSVGATNGLVALTGNGIDVPGPYAYVVTNGTPGVVPQEPYNTWARAATNIQTAVNYAGANLGEVSTVIVSNGTYDISAQITISAGITLRSFGNGVYGGLANASNTVVQSTSIEGEIATIFGPRIFRITDAGAELDGFTIRNGRGRGDNGWSGNGVNMTAGLVRDCIIKENGGASGYSHAQGGGVYMSGGTVSNCIVRANKTGAGGSDGGGIYATGGQILFCQILGNTCGSSGGVGGGGIYASSAVLIRNCLIVSNSASLSGGGIYGGTVESCTIVSNSAAATGGGVYLAAGTVSNSIVYFNTVGGVHSNLNTTAGFSYSCATNPALSGNGNISGDPNISLTDYTLNSGSPCIDKGSNQDWMNGAVDLAGHTRKTYGGFGGTRGSPAVDMGAYEAPEVPPRGTVFLMR